MNPKRKPIRSPKPSAPQERLPKATESGATTRVRIGLALLLILVPVGLYVWLAPVLRERALRSATQEELQERAGREPDNARVHFYLGERLLAMGRKEEANAAFEKAAALSDDEDIYLQWAKTAPNGKDAAILSTYLTQRPQSAAAHLLLAQIFVRKNDYQHAEEQANLAAELSPSSAEAWRILGESALRSNRCGDAETHFRRALRLNAADPAIFAGLGTALLQLRRSDEAVARFQDAARLAPGDAVYQVKLGKAQLEAAKTPADVEGARQSLEAGIRLRPDIGPAYLYQGQCFLRLERWKDAEQTLVYAAALEPLDPDVPFALAQVYRRLGDAAKAEQASRRHGELSRYRTEKQSLMSALLTRPKEQETRLKLARLAAQNRDFRVALSCYQAALAQSPNDAQIAAEMSEVQKRAASGDSTGATPTESLSPP